MKTCHYMIEESQLIVLFLAFILLQLHLDQIQQINHCERKIKLLVMRSSQKSEAATIAKGMQHEMEVYVEVSRRLPIHHYTFKAYIQENNHETEVFSLDPPQDQPSEGEFKQLPTTFPITMRFEVKQYLNISVLERDTKRLFGRVENLSVGELFGSRRDGVKKTLMSGESIVGQVFVHFESREGENQLIILQVETEDIDAKKGFFCCAPDNYYFTITKRLFGRDCQVYNSKDTKLPSDAFDRIEISTRKLCNNMANEYFTFNFYNISDKSLIGQTACSLSQLQKKGTFHIVNGKQHKGRVKVTHQKKERQYEFNEYFSSGMKMALVVGIDFTMSNGPFKNMESLHYFNGASQSYYEKALQEVCGILLDLDYDKLVPVFGFGAIVNYKEINSGQQRLDCFPISGLKGNHDFHGLKGILNGYRACLPHLTFSGPTYLAPIIRQSMKISLQMKGKGQEYMILMLVTDGDIEGDFEAVADLVVECSRLPISIVIIGITNDKKEQWPQMKKIDNNSLNLVSRTGKKAERDMVKFVEFMKCYQIPGKLSEQVLSELPKHVEDYHRLENITPQDYIDRVGVPDGDGARERDEHEEIERLRQISMRPIRSERDEEVERFRELSMRAVHGREAVRNPEVVQEDRQIVSQRKQKKPEKKKEVHQEEGIVDASLININVDIESKVKEVPGQLYTPKD